MKVAFMTEKQKEEQAVAKKRIYHCCIEGRTVIVKHELTNGRVMGNRVMGGLARKRTTEQFRENFLVLECFWVFSNFIKASKLHG